MFRRPLLGSLAIVLLGCGSGGGGGAVTDDTTRSQLTAEQVAAIDEAVVFDIDDPVDAAQVPRAAQSAEQRDRIARSGPPDRFTLQFDDGTRHEIWRYDAAGLEVVFRGGTAVYADPIDPVAIDGLGSTTYSPDLFTEGMTVEELLAVTGQTGYAVQPLDSEVADGRLIVVQGLVAGFDDDGLRYVETIPVELD